MYVGNKLYIYIPCKSIVDSVKYNRSECIQHELKNEQCTPI